MFRAEVEAVRLVGREEFERRKAAAAVMVRGDG
jgi:predicted DNA-binding protein (UPF0251 family)